MEAVEPLTADRVEVLRGPSTLLYGGGAVAGVINVIDGRIPEEVPEKPRLMIQQSNNSVNSGDNTAIRIDTGFDRFAFHIDGYRRKNGNVDIKGFAIDELAVAAREELFHGDDHHDDHGDDHDDDHGDDHGDDHDDDHDDDHGDDHDDDHDDDHEEGHAEHDHGGHEGLEYVLSLIHISSPRDS